jgi:uncharacterized protein (DUF736 family)
MTIIGTFTKQDTSYEGAIATLTLNAKVAITAIEKTSEHAPDFRVFAGKAEIGAAWSTKSKAGKAYLSVKLDDPSFAAALQCRLIETEKGYSLVWSR